MAEVHFIGSILGATDFPSANLCTKYQIIAGDNWELLEGSQSGQTQVDLPKVPQSSLEIPDAQTTVWSHPIDVHYCAKSLKGWPRVLFEIYHQDNFGRFEFFGYAMTHLPSSRGTHDIECFAWRPTGTTLKDSLMSTFLGIYPQLKTPEQAYDTHDRFRLVTETMGKIHLTITVFSRGLKNEKIMS